MTIGCGTLNIGIKHDFPFINIRKVPREVFNISLGTLRILMNDKVMFDRYYCINSKKTHQKLRKRLRTLFFSLTTIFLHAHAFYKYPRFGPWPGTLSYDDLKAKHALCVAARRVYKYNSVAGL